MKRTIAALCRRIADRLDPIPEISDRVKVRMLSDALSGEFGKGIVGRGYEPGTGIETSY